ncbi:uncharacterized protein [Nicotiana tomentosiformis]|uniref:uncharacterized protein n=1 Tax=Nicotiana tomentosiformis TaxID=4098 RepID=UPI00388C8815
MITSEDNTNLTRDPTLQELKEVVFSVSANSATGPNGINELLSKMLNNLNQDQVFKDFYMEMRGPQMNHLSFADDIIISTSGCKAFLQKIMYILRNYEDTFGQRINSNKSHFMTPFCVFQYNVNIIQHITGFTRKGSPITYLGCPMYIGRKRIMYFNDLISKVISRIRRWQGTLLSYGGRRTLIKHVLQSMPIHLISVVSPAKTTLKQIERMSPNFFWGMEKDKKKYHWASWAKMSYPLHEGVIGIKSIQDVC